MSAKYVIQLVQKFQATGSRANKKREENNAVDEMAQIEVLGNFGMTPTSSLRCVAAATSLSYSSVRKATIFFQFHSYKMKIV